MGEIKEDLELYEIEEVSGYITPSFSNKYAQVDLQIEDNRVIFILVLVFHQRKVLKIPSCVEANMICFAILF